MAARKSATRKGPVELPAEGPMGQVFGIRHLSPMGAWHLERLLEKVDPTAVLIEGPDDASHLIEHFLHKKTKPPIAVLAFSKKPPVRSILFPLAAYSPEWVAATWAARNKRLVRFMDLPAGVFLGLQEEEARAAKEKAKEPAPEGVAEGKAGKPTDTQRYLDDPWEAIARLSGDPDHETWWERHFEHSTEEGSYREAIYEFGVGLRSLRDESEGERRETLIREAYMRRVIREVLAEGHDPARVVVVCGAYHASALRFELPPTTDEALAATPRLDATLALMPYSYRRLSSQSGYGAGNHAPCYYQAVWEEASRGGIQRMPPRFLAEVAGKLRAAGNIRSSAEVIEAVRLASGVAALKGDRTAPTLADLRDAATTLLGQGDVGVVRKHLDAVEIGDAIGALPPGVAQTALQDDFHRWVKDLNLSDYLKDKSQVVKGRADKGNALDLREDRFSKTKATALRDRNVSIFLRRLDVLEVGFASDETSESDRRENTFKERWSARWTPECEVNLAECSLLGDTIEVATIRKFEVQLDEAQQVADAAAAADRAVRCNLPHAVEAARSKAQALAVSDGSFVSVAKALYSLAHTARFKDVSDVDVEPLKPLVGQLFLRAVLLVAPASRCDDDASKQVGRAMGDVAYVSGFDDMSDLLPADRWYAALDAVADDDLGHPFAVGVACALLLEAGRLPDDVLDRRIARRISPGMDPKLCAGFFEGLASRNRMALLSRKKLWSSMSEFLEALDDAAFVRSLPGLRRAFGSFEAGEARRVVGILGDLWGGGAAELMAAVETKISDDEASALQEDLGDLGDLDL